MRSAKPQRNHMVDLSRLRPTSSTDRMIQEMPLPDPLPLSPVSLYRSAWPHVPYPMQPAPSRTPVSQVRAPRNRARICWLVRHRSPDFWATKKVRLPIGSHALRTAQRTLGKSRAYSISLILEPNNNPVNRRRMLLHSVPVFPVAFGEVW